MEQEGDCGLGGRQEGGTTRSSAWRDASGLGVQGDLLQEPPRAWVRWLLDELWELDRAKSQKVPCPCPFPPPSHPSISILFLSQGISVPFGRITLPVPSMECARKVC
jgi:hypothetical protein